MHSAVVSGLCHSLLRPFLHGSAFGSKLCSGLSAAPSWQEQAHGEATGNHTPCPKVFQFPYVQVSWPVVLQVGKGDDGCRGPQWCWCGVVRGADLREKGSKENKVLIWLSASFSHWRSS